MTHLRSFGVEVTGWNREGESVEDSTDVQAVDQETAYDEGMAKMIARSLIVEVGDSTVYPRESTATWFEVSVDRDYGADEAFMFDTEAEARAYYQSMLGQPDVRRVWLDGPGTQDQWSAS